MSTDLSKQTLELIEKEVRSQMGLPSYLPLESFSPSMKAGYDMFIAGLQFALTDPAIIESIKGDGWVSVENGLPEYNIRNVIVKTVNKVFPIMIAERIGDNFFLVTPNKKIQCDEVTHWMPLPTLPKQ